MRRLGALVLMGLFGCPDWDAEREARCRALDSGAPYCGGDGGIGGGGGATPFPDGGVDALPLATTSAVLRTYGQSQPRLPVFLWELPGTTTAIAVETYPGFISVWRSVDFQTQAGNAPQSFCAAAASERAPLLGTAYPGRVSVDKMDGLNVAFADYETVGCPDALAAYRRPADGGITFMGITQNLDSLHFARTWCISGCESSFDSNPLTGVPTVNEARTDDDQTVWISASLSGTGTHDLIVVRLPVEGDAASISVQTIANVPPSVTRAELSTSGTKVLAAWLDGETFWLSDVSLDGGVPTSRSWALGEAARLVDLVEGANSVVAILEFSGHRNVLLIHQDSGDSFFRISTPFGFAPTTAHLRSRLRIAGQCDGGGTCEANPVLQFNSRPGGGLW